MTTMLHVDRDQVLAFRLQSHQLTRRLPPGSLLEASAACGLQNTPPGSAALALQGRIDGLTPGDVDLALARDKTLIQVWSVRGAPYVVSTVDLPVFTRGVLPEDEDAARFLLRPHLDEIGMPAAEAIERTAVAIEDALDGRTLTKDDLLEELNQRLPESLWPWCEPCQIRHVRPTLQRAAALWGRFCFAPRAGNEASFVRTDQWLGTRLPQADPDAARAELVRRYLRCYGPSTTKHFAEWAGIAPAHARRLWQLVESELVPVDFEGRTAWLHTGEVECFTSPPAPAGVRLLPPSDPYLLLRDRETLLPDNALQRRVWSHIGNPGAVLVDGRLVATWRPQKKGKRLVVSVHPFEAISPPAHDAIAAEAERLAPYRSCDSAAVTFAE
ncbi:MAG: winged helix DNA-binding domain-containing protein [Chloroflexota bacterium]